MILVLQTAPDRAAERDWIAGAVFGDLLGVTWLRREGGPAGAVRITVEGMDGAIEMPDVFFHSFQETGVPWLSRASLPTLPLATLDARALGAPVRLTDPFLPVLFGSGDLRIVQEGPRVILPIDVFGAAFFMLSRYEECVLPDRDVHDRFPAEASLAYQAGFLERPLIDEYAELLWSVMALLWPSIERRTSRFRVLPSHDVDRPGRYALTGSRRLATAVAGDLRAGQISMVLRNTAARMLRGRGTLAGSDPYNCFDWMMDASEAAGRTSAFYFICGRTHARRDADYELEEPAIAALMSRIHDRGHEIGLHPSYATYLDSEALGWEARRLRTACAALAIDQSEWGGRMHYLRWRHPETLNGWEAAGMDYDSTLGYAEHAGFRCGTCRCYSAFDPVAGKELRLRLQPLIAMEVSVTSAQYMGLGVGEAAAEFLGRLRAACETVGGNFTLLWHNSELDSSEKRELYKCLL